MLQSYLFRLFLVGDTFGNDYCSGDHLHTLDSQWNYKREHGHQLHLFYRRVYLQSRSLSAIFL